MPEPTVPTISATLQEEPIKTKKKKIDGNDMISLIISIICVIFIVIIVYSLVMHFTEHANQVSGFEMSSVYNKWTMNFNCFDFVLMATKISV